MRQRCDTRLQRDVAVKVLPAAFALDPDRIGRLQREALVLASLNHPNVVGNLETDTNTASGAVAKQGGSVAEELHTMDYRIYAYLQTAQNRGARSMLDALPEVAARFDPEAVGSAAPG